MSFWFEGKEGSLMSECQTLIVDIWW